MKIALISEYMNAKIGATSNKLAVCADGRKKKNKEKYNKPGNKLQIFFGYAGRCDSVRHEIPYYNIILLLREWNMT